MQQCHLVNVCGDLPPSPPSSNQGCNQWLYCCSSCTFMIQISKWDRWWFPTSQLLSILLIRKGRQKRPNAGLLLLHPQMWAFSSAGWEIHLQRTLKRSLLNPLWTCTPLRYRLLLHNDDSELQQRRYWSGLGRGRCAGVAVIINWILNKLVKLMRICRRLWTEFGQKWHRCTLVPV